METERGTPDFAALQADLSEGRSDRFRYYLFDLLHLDGIDLTGAALLDRKAALARLLAGHDGGAAQVQRALHRARRGRAPARLPPEPRGHRLQAQRTRPIAPAASKAWLKSKCVDSDEFVIIGYVPSTTQRRVGRLAGARLLRQGQARLCRPRRLGLLGLGGRGPVAPAGSHPPRRARARRAAAGRGAPQRALDQAVAGGRGGAARLDGRRHRAPRRLQGAAPGQAGRRCRSGEARHEAQEHRRAKSARPRCPSRSPIPTACCGPTSA